MELTVQCEPSNKCVPFAVWGGIGVDKVEEFGSSTKDKRESKDGAGDGESVGIPGIGLGKFDEFGCSMGDKGESKDKAGEGESVGRNVGDG